MARRRQLYEGKAKVLFEGPEPGTLVQYFKDDASSGNGAKKGTITGKGVLNNRISEYLMMRLGEIGVPTHFVRRLNMREQLIKQVEIIPLEVVVRPYAAGSFAGRYSVEEGVKLSPTVLEWCLKSDALGDPPLNDDTALALGLASETDLATLRHTARQVGDLLSAFFTNVGLKLIDFKLEFGRLNTGEIVLADEISPDTCRLWDVQTDEKLDKDRFRRDLGGVEDAYREVARRVLGA